MPKTLKLVLTDYWFEEIKSGRKTHEYRKATDYWTKRLGRDLTLCLAVTHKVDKVEFQKAYRKNAEKMTFKIKNIDLIFGTKTDLHCSEPVYDIALGERLK